ncbi:winged helix-turn-helix transcriptional regulator [Pseudomonas sp. TE3610]
MAKQPSLETSECPVARAMEAIGERWSLLIIRDAFDGVRRFGDFHKSLGLAKNILSARLKLLVELGVFEIRPASDGSAFKEYLLTERGRAVFPVVVALRQWGERHLFAPGEVHSVLLDKVHGEPVTGIEVRSSRGVLLGPEDCQRQILPTL